MLKWLAKRPWLLVVLAFAVLIAAWAVLIYLGSTHSPERIELPERGFVGDSSKSEQ